MQMQIVIDLPEEIIADAKTSPNFFPTYHFGTLWKAVGNGTPLPKGHDRLIEAKRLKEVFRRNTGHDYYDLIDNAPTIIEADTESEDEA